MASSVFIWPGFFTANGTTINPLFPIALPDGTAAAPSLTFASQTNKGFFTAGTNSLGVAIGGGSLYEFNGSGFDTFNGARIGFTSSGFTPNVFLYPDAANILALRNGPNPNLFRIANTWTSLTANELLEVGPNAGGVGANTMGLMSTGIGGGTARDIQIGSGSASGVVNISFTQAGTQIWRFNASGNLADLGSHTITAGSTITGTGFTATVGTFLITSSAAFTNGAAAQVATLTNGPTAGNPTKWIPINDNGTTRYIPAW